MSKSNWKGTSGWSATDDPTGVLTGRVLIGSAGATATNSDYLVQNIATGVTFDKVHYASKLEYGWPSGSGTHPFAGGKLAILARSAGFTTATPSVSETYYTGELDVENNQVNIKRVVSRSMTTLMSATMPSTAFSRGVKHTMEFICTGVTQVSLQLIIDDDVVANIGDTSNEKLTAGGYAGLMVSQGTVYIDNFGVYEFTSDGDSASALWLPSDVPATAALSAWYKADTGTTVAGTSVTQWNDQSGNANTLAIAAGVSCPVQVSNDLNNLNVIEFDGTDDFMQATGTATLSLRTKTGASLFAVMKPDNSGTTAGNTTLGTLFNKGTAGATETRYAFSTFANSASSTTNAMAYYKDQASTAVIQSVSFTTNNTTSTSNYGIYGFVTDEAALASGTTYGFWINGTGYQTASTSNTLGTDNVADPFNVGVNHPSGINKNFFNGKVAEIILIDGELGTVDRQKVEGYLAHRYALTGLLPASHPYKTISPKK